MEENSKEIRKRLGRGQTCGNTSGCKDKNIFLQPEAD